MPLKSAAPPVDRADLEHAMPAEVRAAVRNGRWQGNTKRLALGHHQANVTIVPERYAFDFMRFCFRNPKPLPLLDVTEPGDPEPRKAAPGSDIRTDAGSYVVFRDGDLVERVANLDELWRADHVAFLTGCNLSLDQVMLESQVPLPHLLNEEAFPAQYISSIPCVAAGAFKGNLVVSMRPIPDALLTRVTEITSRFNLCHGAPVHIGDPDAIGIKNLSRVDWGKPNDIPAGHTPVFWACGITAQAAAIACRIPEMIAHAPGHMFVTDLPVLESR